MNELVAAITSDWSSLLRISPVGKSLPVPLAIADSTGSYPHLISSATPHSEEPDISAAEVRVPISAQPPTTPTTENQSGEYPQITPWGELHHQHEHFAEL